MSKSNILHKKSFIDLNESDLEKLIEEVGEKNFRINQINNWIYNHFIKTWSEMINLPQSLINQLNNDCLMLNNMLANKLNNRGAILNNRV